MTELTAGRIIGKAADCLEHSREALERKSFEACINRAYYAMFHSIHALLLVSGVQTKTHVGTHNRFRDIFIKTGVMDMSLNMKLQRTFEKRQFGDYDYDEVAESEALESFEDAVHFFEVVVQYLKENNHIK